MIEFNPVLTEKQTIAKDHLESSQIDEILYGGAKFGGKSWFLCAWSFITACELALKYKIPQSDHPLPVGFLGRKVAKTFRETTLETWYKEIPPDSYVAKGNPVELIIDNRVKIITGGFDNRELVNKFNSAEFAFYAIDQAEEITADDIALLRAATYGRLVVNEQVVPGKGLLTANPRNCWLRPEFILNPSKRRKFVPALPTDNPYCTQKYIDNLKDSFKHRPKLLKAYLEGVWDILEDEEQVVLDGWLDAAMHRRADYWPFIKEYIAVDVARFGDDETIILLMNNSDIKQKIVMPYSRTTETSSRIAALSYQNDNCEIVVESTGGDLGAAVVDELIELGHSPLVYCPQGEATDKAVYYNLRAEAWSQVAKILSSGVLDKESNISVVLTPHVEGRGNYGLDDIMRGQLCTPHYKFRKGKILIEKKEDIKKPERLGRSPDHADAYVIALWAWPYMTRKEEQKTTYKRRKHREAVGSAMEF